jgi:hypothetical protein
VSDEKISVFRVDPKETHPAGHAPAPLAQFPPQIVFQHFGTETAALQAGAGPTDTSIHCTLIRRRSLGGFEYPPRPMPRPHDRFGRPRGLGGGGRLARLLRFAGSGRELGLAPGCGGARGRDASQGGGEGAR